MASQNIRFNVGYPSSLVEADTPTKRTADGAQDSSLADGITNRSQGAFSTLRVMQQAPHPHEATMTSATLAASRFDAIAIACLRSRDRELAVETLLRHRQQQLQNEVALTRMFHMQQRLSPLEGLLPLVRRTELTPPSFLALMLGRGTEPAPRDVSQILDTMSESFPVKLYRLIRRAEANNQDHIISFIPDGSAFWILDPKALIDELSPQYFRLRSLASFRRQLYMYGFIKHRLGGKKGYHHEHFHRDRPEFLQLIHRCPQKSSEN